MSDEDKTEKMTFGIREDGTVEVDGTVVDAPLMEELEPAQETPADPEKERLKAELEELEPFKPLIAAIGRRELILTEAAPTEPPPPLPEDIAGYHRRLLNPGSAEIMKQLNDYAALLPSEEVERLSTDHRTFNAAFDRFAEANKPAQPAPPPASRPGKEVIDKILAARESRKDAARTLTAGIVTGGSEAYGPGNQGTRREQEMQELKMRIRRDPGNTDLQAQLAKFYLGDD